jgi:FMN phosphatase YigB (HAD superfamily)
MAVTTVVLDVGETLADETAYWGSVAEAGVAEPARAVGMVAVHIRRGPWGYLQAGRQQADVCIDSLDELPEALARV